MSIVVINKLNMVLNRIKRFFKELFIEFWEDSKVPIGNNQVIELGGFVIVLIVFILVLFSLEYFHIVDIGPTKFD
jgi:hypothetical protein